MTTNRPPAPAAQRQPGKLAQFLRKNTVFVIALLAAVVTAFFVPPDAQYLSYFDWKTLSCLFCTLAVICALRNIHFFTVVAHKIVGMTGNIRRAIIAIIMITFIGSMLIANDMALLTFLPLGYHVLASSGQKKHMVFTFIMQNIGANLGGMLTPFGNPQNLYLYGKSGMDMGSFVLLMLPYSILSLALLALWAVGLCRRGAKISMAHSAAAASPNKALLSLYSILFVLCLLVVLRVLPYGIAFAAVLACVLLADRNTLCRVDYSLILTFVALFIFIGNLGRFAAFSGWLQHILTGHEVWVSVLASQVTSNVPAAILLSGFTENIRSLIIGTNLGGLGTLIASMASLISYREIARELPLQKGRYFALFTVSNILFVTVLMGAWALAG